MKSLSLLIAVSVLASACSFATAFQKPKDSSKQNGTENVAISRFYFQASTNPGLPHDVEGLIDDTTTPAGITFALPYKVGDTKMKLAPTLEVTTGATTNLSGLQDFSKPLTYQVTSKDGSTTHAYNVVSTLDPASVAYLTVSGPFYVNASSGTTVPITSYVLDNTSDPSVYNLELDNTTYPLIYNAKIGFTGVTMPGNAQYNTNEILNVRTGAVMPFTATITSSDKSYTKTYQFIVSKQNPNDALISAFTIAKINNPGLSSDISATINNATNTIALTLPYKITSNKTRLLPTVTASTGATVQPGGTQDFSSPVSYIVTSSDGKLTRTYTTSPTVDPNSVAYLNVSSPFYVDGSGNQQPLTDVIDSSVPNTITLDLDTATYQAVSSSKIGFTSVSLPSNATYNGAQMLNVRSGGTFPYTVTVTSADASYAQTYTFNLVRTVSKDSTLASIVGAAQHQVIQKATTSPVVSAVQSFLAGTSVTMSVTGTPPALTFSGNASVQLPSSQGTATANYSYTPPAITASKTMALTSAFFSSGQALSNSSSFSGTVGPTNSPPQGTWINAQHTFSGTESISGTATGTLSDSSYWNYYNGNTTSTYAAQLYNDGNIPVSTGTYTNPGSTTAPATGSYSPASIFLAETLNWSVTGATVSNGSATNTASKTGTVGLGSATIPFTGTYTYSVPSGAGYYLFSKITVTKNSQFASFASVITSSSLVANYSISGNVLTINLVSPGTATINASTGAYTAIPKQTGIVAVFNVVAEDGSSNTYALTLQ